MLARVDTRPRHRNSGRADAGRRCAAHLQWVRSRPCALERHGDCDGLIEAAHADKAGGKGVALKVADAHAVPLCAHHHRLSHNLGIKTFESRYGFDMVAAAQAFAKASPHWRRLQEMLG